MRITRNQLRQVIREELTRNLFEQEEEPRPPGFPEEMRISQSDAAGDPEGAGVGRVSADEFEALEPDSAYVLAIKQAIQPMRVFLGPPWMPAGADEVRLSVGPGGQAIAFGFGSAANPEQEISRIADRGFIVWINDMLKGTGAKLPEGNHKFPLSAIRAS